MVKLPPKKFSLILMKLWDLIVIGLIEMCKKFQRKKLSGSAASVCTIMFEKPC